MSETTFSRPDLTTFLGLEALGLTAGVRLLASVFRRGVPGVGVRVLLVLEAYSAGACVHFRETIL